MLRTYPTTGVLSGGTLEQAMEKPFSKLTDKRLPAIVPGEVQLEEEPFRDAQRVGQQHDPHGSPGAANAIAETYDGLDDRQKVYRAKSEGSVADL